MPGRSTALNQPGSSHASWRWPNKDKHRWNRRPTSRARRRRAIWRTSNRASAGHRRSWRRCEDKSESRSPQSGKRAAGRGRRTATAAFWPRADEPEIELVIFRAGCRIPASGGRVPALQVRTPAPSLPLRAAVMRQPFRARALFIVSFVLVFVPGPVRAQETAGGDRTMSAVRLPGGLAAARAALGETGTADAANLLHDVIRRSFQTPVGTRGLRRDSALRPLLDHLDRVSKSPGTP